MLSPIVATPRWAAPVAAAAMAVALAACGGGGSERAPVSRTQPQGFYASAQYSQSQIRSYKDVVYSTRPNTGGDQATYISSDADDPDGERCTGARNDIGASPLVLTMDIHVPPNATVSSRQPLLVSVHGGGFRCGTKEGNNADATSFAQAGYVAASINYRLTPDNAATEERRLMAQSQAVEDLQNAIRFLRVNASRYGIDPNRIAVLGGSAGGAMALTSGVDENDGVTGAGRPGVLGSDYPGVSAWAQGVMSTGATLIDTLYPDTIDLLRFDAGGSPTLILHAQPQDPTTGATWTGNVLPTQQRILNGGVSAQVVPTPSTMHTVSMAVGTTYWPDIHAFLVDTLDLP